ncbi:hypothetical protein DJ030_07565 [bacterium endosymbiont of Escarpia laminata]|nr:MAG: hypothetical protein DJ030_07565 [bacterium endosymbiont of Escarpia laminata]
MKQIKLIFLTCASLFILSGCATVTPQQQATINENIPVCYGSRDCETKWAAARKWVLNNAGRKIQIYSDDLIETYNPAQNSPSIAARINKEPTGNGAYAITITVWCNNIFGCVPKKTAAIMDFNNHINAVKVQDYSVYKDSLKEINYSKPLMGAFFVYFNEKVIVKTVSSGSPSEKAGMKPQDIITRIGVTNIHSKEDFNKIMEKVSFGEIIKLNVMRNGIENPLTIELPTKKEINQIRISGNTVNHRITTNDIESKIESLSNLLEKGLITQEEYNKKKTELLEQY